MVDVAIPVLVDVFPIASINSKFLLTSNANAPAVAPAAKPTPAIPLVTFAAPLPILFKPLETESNAFLVLLTAVNSKFIFS